jgi:hypothetical protein
MLLNQCLYTTGLHAPLGGLERVGWRLAYDAERGQRIMDLEVARKQVQGTGSVASSPRHRPGGWTSPVW